MKVPKIIPKNIVRQYEANPMKIKGWGAVAGAGLVMLAILAEGMRRDAEDAKEKKA